MKTPRCLPPAVATKSTAYSDAACGKPIALATPAVAAKYLATPVVAGTGNRLSLLGPKLALANWYAKSGASCVAIGILLPGYDVFDAGDGVEIPPTAFVAFTVTTTTL